MKFELRAHVVFVGLIEVPILYLVLTKQQAASELICVSTFLHTIPKLSL